MEKNRNFPIQRPCTGMEVRSRQMWHVHSIVQAHIYPHTHTHMYRLWATVGPHVLKSQCKWLFLYPTLPRPIHHHHHHHFPHTPCWPLGRNNNNNKRNFLPVSSTKKKKTFHNTRKASWVGARTTKGKENRICALLWFSPHMRLPRFLGQRKGDANVGRFAFSFGKLDTVVCCPFGKTGLGWEENLSIPFHTLFLSLSLSRPLSQKPQV